MVEFRGWWIVLDTVCWIFILIVFGMGVFGAWPSSPWGVIFIAGLVLACRTLGLEERSSQETSA